MLVYGHVCYIEPTLVFKIKTLVLVPKGNGT